VGDGAWVGAGVLVGPGVEIGDETVVSAGSVILKTLEGGMVYSGNPAIPKGRRWKEAEQKLG
jgi:acetyltransferase-like isoleucine patch superfamily enzyme